MRAYLLRLICAAILCALVDALSGTGSGMRKLTAGIFLTLVAFSLPMQLELPSLDTEQFFMEAQQAAGEGADLAHQALAQRISDDCAAYIGTKAEELGLRISAQVELDENLCPSGAILSGTASQEQRQALCAMISRELGIGEEEIRWNEPHQSSE